MRIDWLLVEAFAQHQDDNEIMTVVLVMKSCVRLDDTYVS